MKTKPIVYVRLTNQLHMIYELDLTVTFKMLAFQVWNLHVKTSWLTLKVFLNRVDCLVKSENLYRNASILAMANQKKTAL